MADVGEVFSDDPSQASVFKHTVFDYVTIAAASVAVVVAVSAIIYGHVRPGSHVSYTYTTKNLRDNPPTMEKWLKSVSIPLALPSQWSYRMTTTGDQITAMSWLGFIGASSSIFLAAAMNGHLKPQYPANDGDHQNPSGDQHSGHHGGFHIPLAWTKVPVILAAALTALTLFLMTVGLSVECAPRVSGRANRAARIKRRKAMQSLTYSADDKKKNKNKGKATAKPKKKNKDDQRDEYEEYMVVQPNFLWVVSMAFTLGTATCQAYGIWSKLFPRSGAPEIRVPGRNEALALALSGLAMVCCMAMAALLVSVSVHLARVQGFYAWMGNANGANVNRGGTSSGGSRHRHFCEYQGLLGVNDDDDYSDIGGLSRSQSNASATEEDALLASYKERTVGISDNIIDMEGTGTRGHHRVSVDYGSMGERNATLRQETERERTVSAPEQDTADATVTTAPAKLTLGRLRSTSRLNVGDVGGSIVSDVSQFLGSAESTFMLFWSEILPFGFPRDSVRLQLCIFGSVCMIILGRVLNVMVPLLYRNIVNWLTAAAGAIDDSNASSGSSSSALLIAVANTVNRTMGGTAASPSPGSAGEDPVQTEQNLPSTLLLIYLLLRFAHGGGVGGIGIVENARNLLWCPVELNAERRLQVTVTRHLHELSVQWHNSRRTGELLKLVDRGTESLTSLLDAAFFNIIPTLLDMVIAVVFFASMFDALYSSIIYVTMVAYVIWTVQIVEWRTTIRRRRNVADQDAAAVTLDGLLNHETVKLYQGEEYEVERVNMAMANYQRLYYHTQMAGALLNVGQGFLITFGMGVSLFVMLYDVAQGEHTVGDFVLLVAYLGQLYQPLNWFGSYYRTIQQDFIDMESLIDLLDLQSDIDDQPGAMVLHPQPMHGSVSRGLSRMRGNSPGHLQPRGCEVVFDNVRFGYPDGSEVLRGISFRIAAGKTFAIVGTSGEGKTTILRLVFRFYDVVRGEVKINGIDVRDYTLTSVRRTVGYVPQDTVLFNDTLRENIRYGRRSATDAEVEDAAALAEMHDRILTFPRGYDSIVGERGLKLSGGERQRIALARTFIKDPDILLLDEATSSLDSQTEQAIQSSIRKLSRNRTTIIVAHRLATVKDVDCILVLSKGVVAESGTHTDLLGRKGLYAQMWAVQQQEEELKENDNGSGGKSKETKK